MSDFNSQLEELKKEQEAIEAKKQQLRYQAINQIQKLISEFKIQASELSFDASHRVIIRRKPARIKYRFPDGTEWTGKGSPKLAVKAYLESVGETLDDLPKYLVKKDEE